MADRIFGEIDGIPAGTTFLNRQELSEAKVHPPNQKDISGSQSEGADSIVSSGGYEDDLDSGDVIIYTGAGARDQNTGRQIADQELTGVNLALAVTGLEKLPVRVTRSHNHKSEFSPKSGYRYDGLFYVAGCNTNGGQACIN